ncbi:MAG: uL22 family ribosomal protein [archaeon]
MEDKEVNPIEKKEEKKLAEASDTKEVNPIEKKEEKKPKKKKEETIKKDEAIARGRDLKISTKHSIAICRFIKNKSPDQAIENLKKVVNKKLAVPMKGEIPHRKGIERGRYPLRASQAFIKLISALSANSTVNGLESPTIKVATANQASKPSKRFGSMKFKRTHILLIAREADKKDKN